MTSNFYLLKDLVPNQKDFDCEVIVLQREMGPVLARNQDEIHKLHVADKSGSMYMYVWGPRGQLIRNGDILRISGGRCYFRQGHLQLSIRHATTVKRIGQDTMIFLEKPNHSELFAQTQQNESITAPPPPPVVQAQISEPTVAANPNFRGRGRGRGRGSARPPRGFNLGNRPIKRHFESDGGGHKRHRSNMEQQQQQR